jgi:NADH:ubiquinone oxidoreductase subunit 5 (subunit L)/multisubunit Na+/H+ antiporter MnhA subunit
VAALLESDLKKVVALSTLSQLGFLTYSLSRIAVLFTLFHILTHALAKASLFIVVGKVIFDSFSEQDTRGAAPGFQSFIIKLCGIIRVLSLRGIMFISGFFRKEYVLSGLHYTNNSALTSLAF